MADRQFGEYQCTKCSRSWMSGQSWKGFGQQCKKCKINVLPYKQTPLEKVGDRNKNDLQKPHPEGLCEKCRRLGYPCTKA